MVGFVLQRPSKRKSGKLLDFERIGLQTLAGIRNCIRLAMRLQETHPFDRIDLS